MSARQHRLESWNGRTLQRICLLACTIVGGLALFSVMAANASAKEQRGFFLTGEKSGEESKKPRFEGEIYPTYLASAGVTNFVYTFQPGNVECPGQYSGKLSSASSELAISPFYFFAQCKSSGGSVAIAANLCEHTLTVLNEGPPYVGRFGVKCPTEKSYEFRLSAGCTVEIPAQTALAEVSYKNVGEGKKRGVQATFNVSKLKHTMKGPFFCEPGTYENGTLTGTTTLNGFNEP